MLQFLLLIADNNDASGHVSLRYYSGAEMSIGF